MIYKQTNIFTASIFPDLLPLFDAVIWDIEVNETTIFRAQQTQGDFIKVQRIMLQVFKAYSNTRKLLH